MRSLLAFASILTIATAQAADPAIPDDVIFEKDVEFSKAGGESLQINIARPKEGDGKRPAVLCIHGGGFRAGTRQSYDALCIQLAQRGYVAATVTYRLSPAFQFPAAVQDCKAAVRWLRANAKTYQIDQSRIGAMGGSAGGHLALFLGVTAGAKEFEGEGNERYSSHVKCIVSLYGPSDFTKSYGKSVDAAEVLPLFFGGNLETKLREHIAGSPLNWVTPKAAPTLCIHGTEDKYVAHEQAEWMVGRLKACGVEADLLTLQGAGHGFKGADAEKADAAMFAFLDKHLKRQDQELSPKLASFDWLKAQQNADGSWGNAGNQSKLTPLVLLAFLSHGETNQSPAYGKAVKAGADWLVALAGRNGGRLCESNALSVPVAARLEHAVATQCLCDYYTMSKDESVAKALEQAVAHIVASTVPDSGGWRAGGDPSADDIRLTSWNIMALRSARFTEKNLSNVERTLDEAVRWLESRRSVVGDYRHAGLDREAAALGEGYKTLGLALTARLGWKGDREGVSAGMDLMLDDVEKRHPVNYNGLDADLEVWLYDTWASLMYGGAAWQKWHRWFRDEVINAGNEDGSWPAPAAGVAGLQSEDSKAGAIYRTAVCVLMLHVYYRYTPSFQGL